MMNLFKLTFSPFSSINNFFKKSTEKVIDFLFKQILLLFRGRNFTGLLFLLALVLLSLGTVA